ncbi:hypothetical protein [Ensifer adhaerens]|uniref:hypothetical protein n=1 Tax=Ensifer adhaerens TaxID=106592 RepID=UPI000CF10838|nr:hypothetical protein [Ensifer adhaerens]
MKTLSKIFAASLLGLTALTAMPIISTSGSARADNAVVLVPGQPTGSSGDTGSASSNPDTGTPNSNGDTGAPSSNPDTGGSGAEGSTP